MLPRSASCCALSARFALSFSPRLKRRPELPSCSATEAPASFTTTVVGRLSTPSGTKTGLMRVASPGCA